MDALSGPIPYWIVAFAFLVCVCGAVVLTWYATKEHYQRRELARQLEEVKKKLNRMETESANYKRIQGNRLYRESFEDVSFAALSARKRIDIAEAELKIARELLDLSASKEN